MRKIVTVICFIIFLSFFPANSYSQFYFVNNYSVESGLPTSYVSDAVQDLKGRMWFATNAGISIYDGFQWENLSRNDSLPNTSFRKIRIDEKGIIWAVPIYMCETMVYFKDDVLHKIDLPEVRKEYSNNIITSFDILYESDNPVVCIGTFNGFYVFKNNVWKNYNITEGLQSGIVNSVNVINKKFYITTRKESLTFDGEKIDKSINKIFNSRYSGAYSFAAEKRGDRVVKIWVLGKDWLGWLDGNSLNILTSNFLLPSGLEFESPSLTLGNSNLIFFSNFYFSYYANVQTGEVFPITHSEGFKSDGSTSLYCDREGDIWKTGTRGIDKLNNLFLINYNASNGLQENEVSSIYEESPGKIIFGHNNGLTIFRNGKTEKFNFPRNDGKYPGDKRVLDICKSKNGSIYFAASSGGIGKLDNSGNISWIKVRETNYVSSIASDINGNIWISSNDGIFEEINGEFRYSPELNVKKQFYRRIVFSDDNDAFVLSSIGLLWKNKNGLKYITSSTTVRANDIFAVYKDKQERIFVGTKDGLYIIVEDKLVKFTSNDFKIDNPVYSILQDNSGNYWFGTEDGVDKWDGKSSVRSFVKANGLSGLEVNRDAFCLDTYGNVWIGTESGVSCYRAEYDKMPVPEPEVYFLYAEDANGDKHNLSNNFSMKSDIKSLYFSFRGISYFNEDFIKYRIKLEGFDADWTEISQQHIDRIRYTNLKPGDYKFLVSAKNVSGKWSKIYSSALISIDRPYYQRWWFLLIVIFALVLLLYSIYKYYLNRIYYQKLEEKVKQRTAKLIDTEKELRETQIYLEEKVKERTAKLGVTNEQLRESNASKDKFFSIIAHDLKSPFVGLLGYSEMLKNEIDELPKERIAEYSENLYKNLKNTYNLLENLLNWAQIQTHRMTFRTEKLDLYLEVKNILEMFDANSRTKDIVLKNEIKFNTYIDADKNMFRTIIHNIVSNAIKYTMPGGQVRVYSIERNSNIEIYISDNGIGIEKDILDKLFKLNFNISTKGTAKERGTGLGLILCKDMVEKHSGTIDVKSEPGIGTTFCITLPIVIE